MRTRSTAVVLTAVLVAGAASRGAVRRDVDHVAAFARLYGVVRYFYPSDAAAALDWDRFAVYGAGQTRAAADTAALEIALKALFTPLGPGIEIGARLPKHPAAGPPDSSLIAWRYFGPGVAAPGSNSSYKAKRTHRPMQGADAELFDSVPLKGASVTIDLGSGLRARVPLALSEAEAAGAAGALPELAALRAAVERVDTSAAAPDVDTRLAGVVVAWNVFRHFYPYWPETGVDWDARLRPQLERADSATTRDAQLDALRELVADARDGHGTVVDGRRKVPPARLPIQLALIDEQLVVTASDGVADAPVGAVVSAIDGIPASRRLAEAMRFVSGTTQWKRTRALLDITTCERGAVVDLTVDVGQHHAAVPCTASRPPVETRPAPVTEAAPGIWYVDLTRARMAQVSPVLDQLAHAVGVVFDVRGYPTDAGAKILPYLLDAPENDRWMHIARMAGPFGQYAGWEDVGWDLKPGAPRLAGKMVFLTDGRAISYAESVMGYVADRKLGTIVGSPTAGTNGDVLRVTVPGDFGFTFTGLRVTRHDGRTPFHLVGVRPDVAVTPTLAAVRAGRDEVLEAGLALIRGR